MQTLTMKDHLHARPTPSGIDVLCKLQHFSIITYAVDPARFDGLIPDRFTLDTVSIAGEEKALLSVVPFIDVDFTSAVYPFPRFTMGQTNYRIYITDNTTGERCVWFLGTTLDSWTLAIPRYLWSLPWYRGEVRFDCVFDASQQRYLKYHMETQSTWAPAHVALEHTPEQAIQLAGFPDLDTGLVYLTHPLTGYYHRRDGKLGTYAVWHKQLAVSAGTLISARFDLLSRLGLVTLDEQQKAHSVLIEPINEFTIYLPPKLVN
ncbi:DUF2071 domain-containing protein [Shewanella sp.]|nr:DUF2071 domain-containing protein [Shewanella sp.]